MKKTLILLLALLIVAAGVFFTVAAEGDKEFISPTAPTHTGVPVTVTPPTVPGVISTIPTSVTPTIPGVTGTTAVKPTKTPATGKPAPSLTLPDEYQSSTYATTPDGSTITGTAKPDQSPSSPKTGGTSAEVFAFAAFALACTGTTIVFKKRKASDAQ